MFDLTDLATAVKKTTQKAKNLTMKPIDFVAQPLVDMHKTMKHTLFGPDLNFLKIVSEKEQYSILREVYDSHITEIKQFLKEKKIDAKKIEAYGHAAQLIAAAHESITTPQEKIDAMNTLYDDLRPLLRKSIPTSLKEETFGISKSIRCTESDFEIFSDAIKRTKSFLSTCASDLDRNALSVAASKLPSNQSLTDAFDLVAKKFPEHQKIYQKSLFSLDGVMHTGKTHIHDIKQSCERIKHFAANKISLFGPEKTRFADAEKKELTLLNGIIKKEHTTWKKELEKAIQKVDKDQKDLYALLPVCTTTRNSWKKEADGIILGVGKKADTVQKQWKKGYESEEKSLSTLQTTIYKTVMKTSAESFTKKEKETVYQQHTDLHKQYETFAHYVWSSASWSEMAVVYEQKIMHSRKSFLMYMNSYHKQQQFFAKLMIRVWGSVINELQSFESIIDDNKTYVGKTLDGVLAYLRTCTNELLKYRKILEQTIVDDEATLKNIKNELRDGIKRERLAQTKRTWHQDLLWGTIAQDHANQTINELRAIKKCIIHCEDELKKLEKTQNIDAVALGDQQKTVTIVKTQEQKNKLSTLEKKVAAQKERIKNFHEIIATYQTHANELEGLSKKIGSFAKDHFRSANNQQLLSKDHAKRLNKSSLSMIVDCTAKLSSPLA